MTFEITIQRPSWPSTQKQIVYAADKAEALKHPLRVKGSRVVEVVKCHGSAHDNPHIDHCLLCAPRWGWLVSRRPSHHLEGCACSRCTRGRVLL